MNKGRLILLIGFFLAGYLHAQSTDQSGNTPKVKEVPAASAHGKTISELAKNTPSDGGKGKVIRSAARQKSVSSVTNAETAKKPDARKPDQQGKQKINPGAKQGAIKTIPARPKPSTGGN